MFSKRAGCIKSICLIQFKSRFPEHDLNHHMCCGFGKNKFVDIFLIKIQTRSIFYAKLTFSFLNKIRFFRRKLTTNIYPSF